MRGQSLPTCGDCPFLDLLKRGIHQREDKETHPRHDKKHNHFHSGFIIPKPGPKMPNYQKLENYVAVSYLPLSLQGTVPFKTLIKTGTVPMSPPCFHHVY